jgi:outer membrane protein OmpA-like peptidoglycan-associated protein
LQPIDKSTMPQLVPSSPFAPTPEPSALPPVPSPGEAPEPPSLTPSLPEGVEPLTPPPVRDTLKPSPALRPGGVDSQGKMIPGNHFTLPDELSTIAFTRGADNIGTDALPTLDKIASMLLSNGGVRVTLTAYAAVGDSTPPREARRLSLTRALAVRDYLTAKGISSSRIDVRALGANVPSGDPDRVDIKAN